MKKCQVCKKNPIKYVTRETKDSPKLFVCEQCAQDYLKWGIVEI